MKYQDLKSVVAVMEFNERLAFIEGEIAAKIKESPDGNTIRVPRGLVHRMESHLDTFRTPFYHKGGEVCYVAKTYPQLLKFIERDKT